MLALMAFAIFPHFGAGLLASTISEGMDRLASPHSVQVTADRFEQAVRDKGMMVFGRFDHAAAAKERELEMPPAIVLSFGNPKYGTPFMKKNPQSAIDFPPKALAYEDADGKVWLAFNTSAYLYESVFARHGLEYPEADVAFYANVLKELTTKAVSAE